MVSFSQLQLDAWLAGLLLPFVRILALFTAAPLLSHRSVPRRVRVAAAAAIAFVVAPFASVPAGLSLASASGLGLIVQQVLIGLVLGFAARLLFAVFEVAGEFIGLQMGFSFAGFFDPHGGTESAVGSWLHTLALALFLAMNGHLLLVDALVGTFRTLPVAGDPFAVLALVRLDRLGGEVFRLALALALPAAILLLFVNLVLGFVSRIAPQLNIFAVGFPVTLLAGLAALALGVQSLQQPLLAALEVFLAPLR
ncbi:flagellar biosynthetic protein FliR [Ramlibacter alkalitolerans]|uniref:Flagellar biosynthetic protein FliR n=1 Tax=Ramlibacter alkalitolerans TaxID=2039631 RepID=A0ABS1JKZ2_9BURK|nr:flagellar biosynthetic protein FliR [Ramlibacter alkalitolerans]MBL0424895.1 flagellar biosynthetic protein FliR [Ramlibacter alkalitolerans]